MRKQKKSLTKTKRLCGSWLHPIIIICLEKNKQNQIYTKLKGKESMLVTLSGKSVTIFWPDYFAPFYFAPFLFHIFFCLVSLAGWPIFSPLILFFSFLFCPGNQCLQPAFLIEVTFQCSCVLWSSCSIHNRLHPLLSAFDCLAFPLTNKARETNCLSSL